MKGRLLTVLELAHARLVFALDAVALVVGLPAVVASLHPAALYLIPVNLALNLPAARTYLNSIQPDQFAVTWGALTLPTPAEGGNADPIPSVAKVLQDRGFGALIASADGHLSTTLTISRLDCIAGLLNRPLELSLTGAGKLDAEIVLADGLPARGTTLRVPRESLSLALMDHRVAGKGTATLRLEKGGTKPRLRLAVALDEARLRRSDEPEPSIGEVRMDAEILVTDPLTDAGGAADVTLNIHSARVRDMSSYNAYLCPHMRRCR